MYKSLENIAFDNGGCIVVVCSKFFRGYVVIVNHCFASFKLLFQCARGRITAADSGISTLTCVCFLSFPALFIQVISKNIMEVEV